MTAHRELRGRQRVRRTGSQPSDGATQLSEPLASLHAELLLLREENARLKGAQHDGQADSTQLPSEGPVMRKPLLEICREIERSMVAFEARLDALAATPIEVEGERPADRVNGKRAPDS